MPADGESEKRESGREREKRKPEKARRESADTERKTFGRLSPADRENKWSGRKEVRKTSGKE